MRLTSLSPPRSSGDPDKVSDNGPLDDIVLHALQEALLTVSNALTGIDDVTPTIEEQLEAMAAIRDGADRALRCLVTDARYDGMTWTEVGRALNVTRQSAHERYSDSDEHWFWLG